LLHRARKLPGGEKILPSLAEASVDHPLFHVVALSFPGYAWSEAARKISCKALCGGMWDMMRFALCVLEQLFKNLMIASGYTGFVT